MRQSPITRLYLAFCIIASPAVAANRLEIESVNARLFLAHSGSLSAPLTAKDALWNTIIGEGGAHEPSQSTLIDVIVKGVPGEFDPNWTIDLIVTDSRKGTVLSNLSQHAGVLSASGKFHIAFWLADTGCVPLHIAARIHGTAQSKETSIAFVCGE